MTSTRNAAPGNRFTDGIDMPRAGLYGKILAGLRPLSWSWLWLLLLLVLLGFAARFLFRWLARKGWLNMRFPGLTLPMRRRHHDRASVPDHSAPGATQRERNAVARTPKPTFTFTNPAPPRCDGSVWLDAILETPNRLLEPAIRRHARGLIEANPEKYSGKILPLLSANSHKQRLVAADLLAAHLPRRAEKTWLALLEEEQTPQEVRAEVVQLLADSGADRHEALWLQMLVRDGSPPAAHALVTLPRLEDTTVQALRHVMRQSVETRERDEDLKQKMRAGQIACILGAHGVIDAAEAKTVLQTVPSNHREQMLLSTLRGVSNPWAVERLTEIALHGHAYPALQALLECDPAIIAETVNRRQAGLDNAGRTRALILKWLIEGEGEMATLQQLAAAGNDLARGALQLGRTQRWDPAQVSPDALLAAAQIVSLRLGYSQHTPDQIARAFRKAATGDASEALTTNHGDLQPLAQAYTNAEVYDAVQVGMHTEDGMNSLLASLARHSDNPRYQEEMAFWSDKMPRETRLFLTQVLCSADSQTAREAIAGRAADPCSIVRAAALRSLHARPLPRAETPDTPSLQDSGAPDELFDRMEETEPQETTPVETDPQEEPSQEEGDATDPQVDLAA
jgi:hypothetical protein